MYCKKSQFKCRSKIIKIIEENKGEYFYNHAYLAYYNIKIRNHEEKMDIFDYIKS